MVFILVLPTFLIWCGLLGRYINEVTPVQACLLAAGIHNRRPSFEEIEFVLLGMRGQRSASKPPLDELLKNFFELGGQLYLCTPCFRGRGYDEKTDLMEQAQPIAAAFYTQMLLDARAVVNY